MKVSLTTSAIVHAAVLAAALVTIGAPAPFEVSNMETLPVELVPIEELSQIQQGDKTAPMAERSAPVPTSRPDVVPDAQNIGNNTVDVDAPPTPETKPSQNVAAAAPKQNETPTPIVDTKPNEVKDIAKEETAPPVPTEVAALPQQKPEPVSQPTEAPTPPAQEEATEQEATTQEPAEIPVPSNLPRPAARPEPPKPAEVKQAQAQPAEKPSDKKPSDRKQETAKSASSKASDFNADDVAALLNKQQPSGGGAKRSTETAALGGKTNTGGSKLSQTEMDALRGIIQKNWQIIPGMADAAEVTVRVVMKLDRDGSIIGRPDVQASGGSEGTRRALSGGAYRAVMRSAPFTSLPAEKYDTWSEVIVNFNPSDLI